MWQAVEEWLPFLALITMLVFWQGGLYAEREARAGIGRILPSLVLVALLTARVRDRLRARVRHLRPRPDGGRD